MDSIIPKSFFNNWLRKCAVILVAIVIWFFVNQSITSSKTIPHVPIRIIKLPAGKTLQGLQPNGILSKRVTLTISGTKDVIEELEPGDIEVHIDATNNPDEWIIQIAKKNLVSLNPNINLSHHITHVSHNEFVIKMSRLITADIPVSVVQPIGNPPKGYQFLDVWPQTLTHTITGPEEQIQKLKEEGIELTFDLNHITKADLDALQSSQKNSHHDEISYSVPNKWKQVSIPFLNNISEEINGAEAQRMHINFLRKDLIPVENNIPIRVFYPLKYIKTLNPDTYTLETNEFIQKKNGIYFLNLPLYTVNVSQVFLDIVREHLEISITAAQQEETLQYHVEFKNPLGLEDRYVKVMLTKHLSKNSQSQDRESHLRNRFRDYMQKFALYTSSNVKLRLVGKLEGNQIKVSVDSTLNAITNS